MSVYDRAALLARRKLGRELLPTEESKLQRALEQQLGATAADPEELRALEQLAESRRRARRARTLAKFQARRSLP